MINGRTYGSLKYMSLRKKWMIKAEPHVIMLAKRLFPRVNKSDHDIELADSPESAMDIEWMTHRYPLQMDDATRGLLMFRVAAQRKRLSEMERIVAGEYHPRSFAMALPPREYQKIAAELYLRQGFLLLADTVGLGKTISTITTFTDRRTLPACVVCYPFLQSQWQKEIERFLPSVTTHIVRSQAQYEFPKIEGRLPDVIIVSYYKLAHWQNHIARYCNSVIFDECQELRRDDSDKYRSAKHIAERMKFRLGNSATPIFNYGGEIWNVLEVLKPGVLGDKQEFAREWCIVDNQKYIIEDPRAFGTYLRDNFLMLRRTREEVGRELPDLTIVPHSIDSNPEAIRRVETQAAALAEIILSRSAAGIDKMNAEQQLSVMLRKVTGIAKALYCARFIEMLVQSGEKVLVACWHRQVYELMTAHFDSPHVRIPWVMFTGSETPVQKEAAKQKFISGDAQVLLMSLRSGAGVDGLQHHCKCVVIAEMDWSPAVHEQFIGRVHRDGQQDGVVAYYLISEDGSDPLMAEVLGVKKAQSAGIRSPDHGIVEKVQMDGEHIKRLARQFLAKRQTVKA